MASIFTLKVWKSKIFLLLLIGKVVLEAKFMIWNRMCHRDRTKFLDSENLIHTFMLEECMKFSAI